MFIILNYFLFGDWGLLKNRKVGDIEKEYDIHNIRNGNIFENFITDIHLLYFILFY